jgi:hypothetical protein
MSTSLEELIVNYLDKSLEILILILQKEDLTPDVKTIAIQAVGDICLMSEGAFFPYFNKSMDLMIGAGQLSLNTPIAHLQAEDAKNIHDMRNALIDAFTSIINGIKSPQQQQQSI